MWWNLLAKSSFPVAFFPEKLLAHMLALLPGELPYPMVAFLVVLLKASVLAYSWASFLLVVGFSSGFDRVDNQLLFELSSLGFLDATLPDTPPALLASLSQTPCYLFLFPLASEY